MYNILVKCLITSGIVVVVSEVAKRSGRMGALVGALPLVSILTMLWLYHDRQPAQRISEYAGYTLWYVVPTLPFFLLFPVLNTRFGFWIALGLGILSIFAAFLITAAVCRRFGIELI